MGIAFKNIRKWTRSWLKLSWLALRINGHLPVADPFSKTKRSDTLFILGTGSSINALTPEHWKEIGDSDSVGLNAWLLHDFVPQWYVFEPFKPLEATAFVGRNLKVRGSEYRNTGLLLKDSERYRLGELRQVVGLVPEDLRKNLRLSWDWEPKSDSAQDFDAELAELDAVGVVGSPAFPAVRKRASIFFLCVLAMRAKYKRIVLCGVDLNDSGCFYYPNAAELTARGFDVGDIPTASAVAMPHKSDDPNFGRLTISQAMEILDLRLLKPRGIDLYVGFQTSRLHPVLPAYFG